MRTRLWTTALLAAAAVGYFRYGRPWQLTWGATPTEVSRPLPGDGLVTRPTFKATRAITIAAPPEEVWPWLVQVGVTRAGWYSYDILDNFMRPSAHRIIPELQALAPGDVMGMSPDGKQGIKVHAVDPPHSMIWATLPDTTWGLAARRQLRRVDEAAHPRPLPLPVAVTLYRLLHAAGVR